MKKKPTTYIIASIVFLIIWILCYIFFLKPELPDPLAELEYAAQIQPLTEDLHAHEGERIECSFKITNIGRSPWSSHAQEPCFFSYHLLDKKQKMIQYDNRRFLLPDTVNPGDSIDLNITLRIPLKTGSFVLEFDLLREGIAWFKDSGSPTAIIPLEISELTWPDIPEQIGLEYGRYTLYESSNPEINTLYKLIRLALSQNEVSFPGQHTEVFGFSAGQDYPQIWIRDANTIIPASRYFYAKSYLSSWLEELLSFQDESGSIPDWVDSLGKTDKNTTETDQETSAVQSAHQIFTLLGNEWLHNDITGKTIIQRLNNALSYVLESRFDKASGLLTGAHTADWGDVDMVDPGQQAIYVDENTHWTTDIYDQSMFFAACHALAEMYQSLSQASEAKHWLNLAASIQSQTNRHLWQEELGFYRVHTHLDSLQHDFNEDDMFAMGGNALAICSGLANSSQARSIIETAIARQQEYGLSTISGTLLPPYPSNVFAHPLMDDPFEYQNGGQWDWFGGKLILAMFEQGYSQVAKAKLQEIIQKNIANRGFFEWDNRDGIGLGSDKFAGTAGVLSQAVMQGYFGILLDKDSLALEPKLGQDSAKLHVYIPANDVFVAYFYTYNAEASKIIFQYNSNVSKSGTIKILSPWPQTNDSITVSIDGKPISSRLESKHQEIYIVFQTDFKNHTAEINLN